MRRSTKFAGALLACLAAGYLFAADPYTTAPGGNAGEWGQRGPGGAFVGGSSVHLNIDGTPNPVMIAGFNCDGSGAAIDPTKPVVYTGTEYRWVNPANHDALNPLGRAQVEWYVEVRTPNGAAVRPFSFAVDAETGDVLGLNLEGNVINFLRPDGRIYATFWPGDPSRLILPWQPVGPNGEGNRTYLQLGDDDAIYPRTRTPIPPLPADPSTLTEAQRLALLVALHKAATENGWPVQP